MLDGPVDPALERLTRLTRRVLGVPTAMVTLVDRNRQFFAAHSGLAKNLATARETSLDYSFRQHVVAEGAPLVVADATVHPLVHDNKAINEYGVYAYAGMPLRTADGLVVGSFCAFDSEGREWSQEELDILQDLARAAMTEIELRLMMRLLKEQGRCNCWGACCPATWMRSRRSSSRSPHGTRRGCSRWSMTCSISNVSRPDS